MQPHQIGIVSKMITKLISEEDSPLLSAKKMQVGYMQAYSMHVLRRRCACKHACLAVHTDSYGGGLQESKKNNRTGDDRETGAHRHALARCVQHFATFVLLDNANPLLHIVLTWPPIHRHPCLNTHGTPSPQCAPVCWYPHTARNPSPLY